MTDLATIKQALWEVVKTSVTNPKDPNAMVDFFRLDAELESKNYTCYLSPMHRKVSICLAHLKDWKYMPGCKIPKEGLQFIQEAFWIFERAEKAKDYLYETFYVADLLPCQEYDRLAMRLLSTAYDDILPSLEPKVYGRFIEFTRALSHCLSSITFHARVEKRLDGKRVLAMIANFQEHVNRKVREIAMKWESNNAQWKGSHLQGTEKERIEMLAAINESHIAENYWSQHFPTNGGKINDFISNLRMRSGEGHLEELIDFINLLGWREFFANFGKDQDNKSVADIFTEQQQKILALAQVVGYYVGVGEKLLWQRTDALHDYFLGKLFCGDYTIESEGKHDWCHLAGSRFPLSKLQEYFGSKAIGRTRASRTSSPADYGIIDDLFKNLLFNPATKEWEDKYNR